MSTLADQNTESERHQALMEALGAAQDVNAFWEIILQMDKEHRLALEALRARLGRSEHLKFKLNTPDEFHGTREKLETFLFQMELKFEAEPDVFSTDHRRTICAISYRRGEAYKWVIPAQRLGLEALFPTYTVFRESLVRAFGDPNKLDNHKQKIRLLWQHGSCADYTRVFMLLCTRLSWNQEALRSQY
ncbi:protein of unknown function [Taphrina deformans PYCC 5710]|uniref:Retrotransposon gag domain-containing protein n=1 Tax=Taphrina deformans (strain PYCC 5710 / ATCC 11124 / CBS 356.35 / IMI 108563 / JCM 9778 / NBRC 8474) TaxID=1097556 RepID=R4XKW6_TAPDE|nr:protein of unknown function [Taphrina deformans PYCC 5710]|eukprot:CCG85059.2 protein of unknown function [Taphrina deformans PYCC 5710]